MREIAFGRVRLLPDQMRKDFTTKAAKSTKGMLGGWWTELAPPPAV
jgi:hypothetical protein